MSTQLRGVRPTAIKRRLKAMIYGGPSVGKSWFCTKAYKGYFIDCERASQHKEYIAEMDRNDVLYFQTNNYDDMLVEIRKLASIKHDRQTLVIDPITTIYTSLLEQCTNKLSREGKADDMRRIYGMCNLNIKKMINLLYTIDMNIIMTAHVKDKYDTKMNFIGETFDMWDKIKYMFDLILEAKIQPNGKRTLTVQKTRMSDFKMGETFDFDFEEFSRRYPDLKSDIESVPLNLVSDETLIILKKALKDNNYPEEKLAEVLAKKQLFDISELTETQANDFINSLKKKASVAKIGKISSVEAEDYDAENHQRATQWDKAS